MGQNPALRFGLGLHHCGSTQKSEFEIRIEPRRSEAVRELESTGEKSTGICTGCTAAGRHSIVYSIAELEVDWKHVI